MNPKRKIAQIDRLAEAIGYVGTDFERFGCTFLDALLEIPMNHQGTNLLGYAVGGVVDTVSADGRVAAEYSDVADYFSGIMSKAESDLHNALTRKPSATEIFLLSGSRRRPQIAQAFETRIVGLPSMAGRTLHVWGAEEIATRIINELIFSDTVVRRLAVYLPELQRIRDEEAVSQLAPAPDRSRLLRPEVDAEILRRLQSHAVVTISGMGGIGKSAAAAAFAADHENDYDLIIWLGAGEAHRREDLQALSLVRGGEARNIIALLQTRACLLVIDDADSAFSSESLTVLCGPKSHIILTQRTVSAASYQLPMLSRAESEVMLNASGVPCPAEIAEVVWDTVGGHPLTLGLISAAVEQGETWAEIEADCRAVGWMEHRGQRLADRLLGRLRSAVGRELSVFAWAEQPVCEKDFLEEVIQPLGIRKLHANGLTSADRSGITRIHDVVFEVLKGDQWCSPARAQELDIALEGYLITAANETGLRFWSVARILRSKLEKIVAAGSRNAVFRYALLSIWDVAEFRPELIGDPLSDAQALTLVAPPPLSVAAVIEAIEQLYLYDKQKGENASADGLRRRLPAFEILDQLPNLTDREQAQIRHHKGKALKRLGDVDAAADLFEAVLSGPSPMNEARLQLIDIYRGNNLKDARAIELADEILGRVAGEEDVTYSVFLGLVERLPAGAGAWRSSVIRKHSSAIERTIVEAANVGVQQAFMAFAAIGRYLSKEEPELFQRILQKLPEPTADSVQTDSDRFAWAEIYFEASRLPGAEVGRLHVQALALYEAEARPQPFHLQRRAELLIEMDRSSEAELLLRARQDLEKSEWLQRLMARARFAQNDPTEALFWINRAMGLLRAEHFRSEFLELRFDIRVALLDPTAPEDLLCARAASQKEAEAARLETRLCNILQGDQTGFREQARRLGIRLDR